jgi:hypothetical protein
VGVRNYLINKDINNREGMKRNVRKIEETNVGRKKKNQRERDRMRERDEKEEGSQRINK